MFNDLHGPDGRANGNQENGRENGDSPLSDREVPLNPRRTPAVVHAWLDGEVSLADASRGDTGRDVEFWSRINEQANERRHMRTPVHVQQRIIEAIPKSSPAAAEAGWFTRDAHISNGALVLIGVAMAAVGLLAAMLIAR
jgi:hypothetical protein